MPTKPPPDSSTDIKIAIQDVLDWELYKEHVSSAIVDHTGATANIPDKYRHCWMATAIEITGKHFHRQARRLGRRHCPLTCA